MLWFRLGAVLALLFTMLLALAIGCGSFIMCVNPASARSMNHDPYYNGTLFFYCLVIICQVGMLAATFLGAIVAFRVWRNNHQLDHKLRHLFTMWLASLGLVTIVIFVLGILGIVRIREPQEEIVTLYEIFAKYNQDIKFVGSFERYQRENSCCGINSPEDWFTVQLKTGGGSTNYAGVAGYGAFDMSYMGSPSTGKCHLTPPTIPMGCGKKLLEEIHFLMTVYSAFLVLETASAVASAVLGWYCFFYWIEKEVIIIPEDEVSNLIVIEPESSTTTMAETLLTNIPSTSEWSGSVVYSPNGSQYTSFTKGETLSRFSRRSGFPSSTYQRGSRFTYDGYSGSRSFYPNSKRTFSRSRVTRISNFNGSIPEIGGPNAEYNYPDPDHPEEQINNYNYYPSRVARRDSRNNGNQDPRYRSVYRYPEPQRPSFYARDESVRSNNLHQGYYGRSVEPHHHQGRNGQHGPGSGHRHNAGSNHSRHHFSRDNQLASDIKSLASIISKKKSQHKKAKKKHSFNHMLHKQERALGGKVLAEMHIDHDRDPGPINSNMDTGKAKKGHRAHHATIAIIKNKTPPKPKTLVPGPEQGHGQTGHLAQDIIEMSGAPAVKSLIDDLNLPVEHDPHLAQGKGKGYVDKLHRARKKKGQLDHPDAYHPGHGPVTLQNGVLSAPSIDGSQAQSLMDSLLAAKPKVKPVEPVIKAHSPDELPNSKQEDDEPAEEPKAKQHRHQDQRHSHNHHNHHGHNTHNRSRHGHGHHHHRRHESVTTIFKSQRPFD